MSEWTPPEGAQPVYEETEEVQEEQGGWKPPSGAIRSDGPTEEVEEEVVVEEPVEDPIPTAEEIETKLNEEKELLYEDSLVKAHEEKKAKLKKLKDEKAAAHNKDIANDIKPKDLDYKRVVTYDKDGNETGNYSYASVYNMTKGELTPEEYVKRFQGPYGSAEIIDTSPPEIREEVDKYNDPATQQLLKEQNEERNKHIKALEAEINARDKKLEDYNARKDHQGELLAAKNISKNILTLDKDSDRTKKEAGLAVFGSISDQIEGDFYGKFGRSDDEYVTSVMDGKLPPIMRPGDALNMATNQLGDLWNKTVGGEEGEFDSTAEMKSYINGEKRKEYLDKYFRGSEEFYQQWRKYSDSEGEDFDYEWIGKNMPSAIDNAISTAKDKELELFYIRNNYTPEQRRITSEFLADEVGAPISAQELRETYNNQYRNISVYEDGEWSTKKVTNQPMWSKYANDGEGGFVVPGKGRYMGEGFEAGNKEVQKTISEINQQYASVHSEMEDYRVKAEQFNEANKPYTDKLTNLQDQIKAMEDAGINSESSPAEINQYNKLLSELKTTHDDLISSGYLDQQKVLADQYDVIEKRNNIILDKSASIGDLTMASKVAIKDFSNYNRMMLMLEKDFIAAGDVTLSSLQKGIGDVAAYVGLAEEGNSFSKSGEISKKAAINYYQDLQEQLETGFVHTISVDDVDGDISDYYAAQMFANNSPSIVATIPTLMTGGTAGFFLRGSTAVARKLAIKEATKYASRLSQAAFFNMGYGGKLADMEIAYKEAPKRIASLQKQLDNPISNLSELEKLGIQEEINNLQQTLTIPQWKRSGNAFFAGSTELLTERLGTLSYINNLSKFSSVAGSGPFKRIMYGGLNTGFNIGTEIGEEMVSQMAQNLGDIVLLGEDKSITEGINKDFLVNTAFTSMAIQGPAMGTNMYNMIADEVKSRADRKATDMRRVEMYQITEDLRNPTKLTRKQRKEKIARQREIMAEEALADVMSINKINRLSQSEQKALFDLNRKRRKLLKDIRTESSKGDIRTAQKRKQQLISQFKKVNEQRNELLSVRQKAIQKKADGNFDAAQFEWNMGMNDFYTDLVEMNQYKNKQGFFKYDENNPPNVEELTKKYGAKEAQSILKAFESGSNAANIGDDIFLFQNNIDQNMGNTMLTTESEIAAVAPMHELLHIQNRKAGLVKDGEIVGQANQAIMQFENTMQNKLATGKITQEQFDNFQARKKLYTTNKGVNVEEMLNLYGDFVSIGALNQSDFNGMFGIKNTLSSLVNKFNPSNQAWLMPMKSSKDVYSYLKSFRKSAADQGVKLKGEPEEGKVRESVGLEASNKVQEIYDTQGQAGAFDIIEQFKPIVNRIVQKRSEAPGFDRQLLTDEIETGKRGILDLIQEYNPESGVPLAAYINKYLPARAIEASKRILGEQFEDDIADQKDLAMEQEEVYEGSPGEDTKTRSIKLKDRLTGEKDNVLEKIRSKVDSLPLDKLNFKSLKNIALKEVQELFGIKPKSGNLTKQDVANAQQYINKNAAALIAMLPEGATPSGTSTGVQKVLLDNFYTKTKRASMAKTGSKAGLAVYEKNKNISESKFKEVFGITPAGIRNVSDRNTSARIKALVAQTERMLTNQEVREVMEKEGRPVPQALTEGKSDVMFSKSLIDKSFTKEQQDLIKKISEVKNINQVAKLLGLSPMTVNDKNRVEKQAELLKAIKLYNLSSNVFEAAMPAAGGAIRKAVGAKGTTKLMKYLKENNIEAVDGDYYYLLDNGKWVRADSQRELFDQGITNLQAARNRLYYGKSDPAYKEAFDATTKDTAKFKRIRIKKGTKIDEAFVAKNKEQSDINMNVLEDVSMQLQEAVKLGMDPSLAGLIIAQGYQATTGLIKVAAPFNSVSQFFEYSKKGKQSNRKKEIYIEEHNPPASVVGASLIFAITQGKVKELFPYIRKNYKQTQLSKHSDFLLDQSKLDAVLPKGVTLLDNSVIRYAEAGINLNRLINLETGKTFAEEQGLGVAEEFKNDPNVIAMQNQLVAEQVFNQATKKETAADLKEYIKLVPDMAKAKEFTESILKESKALNITPELTTADVLSKAMAIDQALRNARNNKKVPKKIRVFDFDDTIATTKSNVLYTLNGKDGVLTAEEFAAKGEQLKMDGAIFDFSEFNKVNEGKKGPLWNVAKAIKEARGNKDLFILTARSAQAQDAIYDFLKAQGLEFRKENIIGLGNSTGAAKANWIIDKAAEGYNDFYFADDAYQNVQAVQDVLSVVDVKSKVQQAVMKESKSLNKDFNNLLEQSTGTLAYKKYSEAKGKVRGASKGRFKFWIPPSAEDFVGLIYPTLGKGEVGERQMAWYKENLLDPYAKAMENLSTARLNLMQDFKALKKRLNVPKTLTKEAVDGFTNEQAVRVYLWNKNGVDIPGLSQTDIKELSDHVANDPLLKTFAKELETINKEQYPAPDQNWLVGTITTDLIEGLNTVKRKKYLEQWQQNADEIYSKENLNKLEAIYGSKYREALENMLQRMKTGKNRTTTGSRLTNKILDYINSSNAAIMFFNMRSAALQTISAVNFLNWGNNNPYKAGKAFANQPQYWADFTKLMNSDFLKDRRNGLRLNIHESEVAEAAKTAKNKAKGVLQYILAKGYLPTQYADSFAIASGGATFYRNRINELVKQGVPLKTAEETAMREFREIAEESQQSSRPDKISQQQASPLGRLILMFANTPMQYARIQKRAFQDLVAGRGDKKTHVSKIVYYGIIQNLLFNALQQGLFALGFGDDDELDEDDEKKIANTVNGMLDSTLRGLGVGGAAVSVVKNFLYDIYERSGRSRPEYTDAVWKLLQFSPPISSKISKIKQALWAFNSKKRRKEIFEGGFGLDNPAYESAAKVISATMNIPLDRVLRKWDNISSAMEEETEWWESVAMIAGWPSWSFEDKDSKPKGKTTSSKKGGTTRRKSSVNKGKSSKGRTRKK